MDDIRTSPDWVSLLGARAARQGGKPALHFYPLGEDDAETFTYAELDGRARRVAVMLRDRCAPGDRVLLLYPSGLEFVAAYFGCLYAGVVAVPAYPPRANENIRRLRAIVADAGARVALTTGAVLRASTGFTPESLGDRTLQLLATDDLAAIRAEDWREFSPGPGTLAMLQYTSGSTGQPKGVMLTHGNLLANQAMIASWLQPEGGPEITAGWLPLFHDMGLIGVMMMSLYSGGCAHLMPPAAFLQKPLRWLKLIARTRAAISPAPNFAFDLCARRIPPADVATLDLSTWRCALNGSEPIHAATLERFAAAFAPAGFRREKLMPCYGMAEASLLIAGKPRAGVYRDERVDPARLAAGVAVPTPAADARMLVSSGRAAAGMDVAVVDPQKLRRMPDGEIGEIWARGASVGLGYWNQPELNREVFGAHLADEPGEPWLRTGDLGYLRDGELFVTGRRKDVIIVRGRNLYPQDLEATALGADPALRAHGAAAFAVEQEATEGVVLVLEVERTALRRLNAPAIFQAVRTALAREHEVAPAAIVLVKPATVPKTSSGKIQRSTCRAQFLTGELDVVARWQDEPAAGASAPAAPALRDWLVARVAAMLGVPSAAVDPRAPLHTLGLDSVNAVALSAELEGHLGRAVEPTIVYNHPTIDDLARHFGETENRAPAASAVSSSADRAIAIIGLGCRFPGGAVNPAAFWELLRRGGDATGEVPASRWSLEDYHDANPDAPGRMYVRRGAFLDGIEEFDPDFFGIAQRDAEAIDPQHRLLLEVAWEALEDAGLAPGSPARAETGVFVGLSLDDYARTRGGGEPDAYTALGGLRAMAAARLSYHLGLQGPSMMVDTLCSSSLLAVHLAMQSLRAGECRVALAGGANLLLDPAATVAACKLRALAPDGRCKTFDAAADGYARGEGAGLVVLKRLADARADGDPILAVLRGSAVNHDGRSNGLTAPNGAAQEALLRRALADAGAAPAEVAYVEAHGTGTVLGDPIEVQALGRVYAAGRAPSAALQLGTVKTNVGHLESAAGVAGLIKTVLALRHGELPASLHFTTPNPHIPWEKLAVRVVDRGAPWPAGGQLAGVSSFGLGGTNVHVLLEAAPACAPAAAAKDRPLHLLTVSGRTPEAAAENAAAWASHLATAADELGDLCFTANTGRTPFAHRAAVVAASREEFVRQLRGLTPADFAAAPPAAPAVAWLFTGQGSLSAGVARELYDTHAGFRATVDECADHFAATLSRPLTEALFASDPALLDQTLEAQPSIFSLQMALGRLWLEWGVRPAGIFGHSIGEYAAACLAGVFSLADAAKLVAAKARLTHALPPDGAMLAAAADPALLAPHLAAHPEIEIAACNGPAATTLAGPAAVIARFAAALARAGIGAQPLPMTRAFHSRALEPVLDEFARVAETITFHPAQFPLVTSLDGRRAGAEISTARYWVRQMREPVQFMRGVETLARECGCSVFVELGPKPSLSSLGQMIFPRAERAAQAWLPSLRPGRSDWAVMFAAAGALFARGVALDWSGIERGYARRRLNGLPTYRFQRRRCWIDAPAKFAPASPDPAIPTFSIHWHETSLPAPSTLEGEWGLLSRDPELGAELAGALTARGQRVRRLEPGVPPELAAERWRGLIVAGTAADAVGVARRLIDPARPVTRLWLVTRRAVATGREQAALDLEAAPISGFARAFALEHPGHWGGLLDFDELTPDAVAALADELLAETPDDFVVWRKTARLVPRLLPHAIGASEAAPTDAGKTQLITGGTGALGLAVARWLVARGARHLALMSRRPPTGAARAAVDELIAAGADVRVYPGDVSVRADVERVFARIAETQPTLAGVFHAAGVPGFAPLANLSAAEFDAVQAPKVAGARHLHELTRGIELDHFVLFSSIASVWGSQGQTHYAAGNAYLDALAHERRRLGLPALSVNWGPWSGAGMADATAREQLGRIGLTPLPPRAAVDLLGRLMANGAVQVTAARVDWSRLRPVLTLRRPHPLLDAFAGATAAPRAAPRSDVLSRLRTADATQRTGLLEAYLQTQLARVLGRTEAAPIDPQAGFFALGLDSLMAVELRTQLETDLDVKLPTTIAFDRATLAALREELVAQLFPGREAAPGRAVPVAPAPGEPIAIIGLGCRFPGGVTTPEGFWELLREGRHGIRPVPTDRWEAAAYYHPDPEHAGTTYARAAGFIDGVDQFDPAFFGLFPREAAGMDPQQRLLLETTWHALESAGLANAGLRGSATGTFVGVSTNDYAQLLLKAGGAARLDAHFGTGNALNAVAGRVAYTFGLRGPALVTDTACSSSLVALHQACASLRAGECEQAIVAGVNLMLTPEPAVALARARMLAADGHCKTFDAAADGYGRGEGCGVVIVKRLADARAAGDTVLAVITGSAVNQDGASSGFTVPSGDAQQELVRRALAMAGRAPDEIDYVEAHGTGTPLGDPIEINALARVIGAARRRPLLVGSVKTNLGHLESAAGIAGVIKTVLALRHGAIPAHLGFTRPSPHIPWAELPVRVPVAHTAWPGVAGRPRVAGVSAFGFTGTNAHVILESAPEPASASGAPAGPWCFPLSARTPEALVALRRAVAAWLEAQPELAPVDVARTLGAGRRHFAWREGYVAKSVAELKAQLAARTEAPAAATRRPLAFVCVDFSARVSAAQWQRLGVSPAWVAGEGQGLLAAAVLAGVLAEEDAAKLAADPAALDTVTLSPPRLGFGHRRLGRVADATAASRAWWRAALADESALAPGERWPEQHELVVAAAPDAAALAALYVAGHDLDWGAATAGGRHRPDAPGYPFQRRRHWIDTTATPVPAHTARAAGGDAAALLGTRLVLPGATEIRFATEYSDAIGFLEHHRLFGRIVAPGAQHIALLIAAARSAWRADSCTATEIVFSQALLLRERERRAAQLVLAPGAGGGFSARVLSEPAPGAEWQTHATAVLQAGRADTAAAWEPVPAGVAEMPGPEFYRRLGEHGYTLGPSFRWVQSVRVGAERAEAVLAPPPGTIEPHGHDLHPGLIDSCFQLIGWAAGVDAAELHAGGALYIPAKIDRVVFHRRAGEQPLRCIVRSTSGDHRRTHRVRGDLCVTEADGTVVLEVFGFEARRVPRAVLVADQPSKATDHFYRLDWAELPAATKAGPAPAAWSLLGAGARAEALAARLRARGDRVELASTPGFDADHVVVLPAEAETPDRMDTSGAAQLLALVQQLAAQPVPPRLWVVTRGGQALPDDHAPPRMDAAAAIGLARIVALEHPALRVTLIDLDPSAPAGEELALEQALSDDSEENQIALRGPRRLAARFVPATLASHPGEAAERLALGRFGQLDTLALAPAERRAPGPGEVEIEVRAAGLNFRDVLGALGLMKEHLATLGVAREDDLPFGGECAGVVRSVGAGATRFRPGDEVITGLAPGSMASHLVVAERLLASKPPGLTPAEAATLPVAYLTAWHALHTLARVQPGERVLIHAAAGGVGMAAVQVARLHGAEVLATASPAKWPALRALGVTVIGHSRQTDYAKTFPRADVVLNSLVGEHIPASLDLLNPGGRFVEIGKLGTWTPAQVAARRQDVAYFAFDLVEMDRRDPLVIGRLLAELAPHWAAGRLTPLPLRVFPLAEARAAFRYMAQARQVGKVVLTRPPATAPGLRRDGVYLVTGGLGGLGFAVAQWLARNGAGTLVLSGRRPPDAAQEKLLEELRAGGARCAYLPADFAQPGAATALVARCLAEHGALRGVFHAAGAIDDGLIAQQSSARLAAVFAPKAGAAWELHAATLTQPLDHFVLFSSLASVLGSPGQATYAAANAALDALAQYRARLGRPALSVNWGPWAEVGMSARLGDRERARQAARGLRAFAPGAGVAALAELLTSTETQVAAVELDRAALLASCGGKLPPILRALAGGAEIRTAGSLVARLRSEPAAERVDFVVRALSSRLAAELGLAADEVLDPERDLTALGLDSLMTVELQHWVGAEFGIEVPIQRLAGLSLAGLARFILGGLGLHAAAEETNAPVEAMMRADAELPADIRPAAAAPALAEPRVALLTGATGYLGAFLLHELITTTRAQVHCLVRCRDAAEGRRRILENLRGYGLPADIPDARLVVVPGDLAEPRLGLGEEARAQLAGSVDAIYHNGAWLNFFYPYTALRAANVQGTLEVLRLATQGRPKAVHYVSTSGVFYSRAYRGRALPETDAAEECAGHAFGYSQSKWVAERLVTAAAARGLAVTIHRAPFITGHAVTGAWNHDDFICRFVRGVIALGAMPDLDATMDLVPVDYVARAIMQLSQQPASAGRRFHLCAAGVTPWSLLAEWLAAEGYPVRREPYEDWIRRLPALRGTAHPLAPFVSLFVESAGPGLPTVPEVFLQSAHARLDGAATARELAATGLAAPRLDAGLWRVYLERLRADGVLPPP